jgi:hypothetical protein
MAKASGRALMLVIAMLCVARLAGADGLPLPCEVPFECVTNLRMANGTASWKISVDAKRLALYDIVHWELVNSAGRSEVVAHLSGMPDGGQYYRIHENRMVRDRKSLWLRRVPRWVELQPWSRAYLREQQRLVHIFILAMALRHGADPLTLSL